MNILHPLTRRTFLGVAGAGVLAGLPVASAAASNELRVGIVGCGARGVGAAINAMTVDPRVRIVSLGDTFESGMKRCVDQITKYAQSKDPNQFDVPPARRFIGLNAYRDVIQSGIDLVILAAPGGFRPLHLKAAVEAGLHIFAEKPVAVDVAGYKSVLESNLTAKQKNLAVVCGFQRRHQTAYLQSIQQIRGGAIGKIVSAEAYWKGPPLWVRERQPGWSDLEWQIRNWINFAWLSGDHIVELFSHNIDIINWALGATPAKASGSGGRQERTDPKYGNNFDHFSVTFEYPGGVKVLGESSQLIGRKTRVGEVIQGTQGSSELTKSITGKSNWKFSGPDNKPYEQEWIDLLTSIRAGRPLNDLQAAADSTMSAILGRMAVYSGEPLTWEQALATNESLMPERLDWGPLKVAGPGTVKKVPTVKDDSTLYAFLVGCTEYDEKELRSLQYSRNDVTSLHRALRSTGFAEQNIVLMHDKQTPDFLPESRKIKKQLNLLLGGLRPNDTVIVAFAGHGVQFQGEKQAYFCPRDAELKDKNTLLSLADVYKQLDACRARKKLLLVDACRNDPLSELSRSRSTVQLESVTRPPVEAVPEGIVALFSCSAGQKAYEHPDLKHGIFFHEVITALSGAAADSTGDVTLNGFLDYVQRETQKYARLKLQTLQVPQQKNEFSGTWILQKRK